MKVQEWLNSGADYDTGLILYSKLPKHNKNLMRLFMRKNSRINYDKLKYELKKLCPHNCEDLVKTKKDIVDTTPIGSIMKNEGLKDAINLAGDSDELPPGETAGNTDSKYYRLLRLNQLSVDLHPLFIKQKNDFYKACSLKIELNDLPADDESRALEIALEIDRLFDSIEKAWKIFDHYQEHKVIPEIETSKNYEDLTPVQLLKAEKSKREAISKARARIKVMESKLEEEPDKKKKQKLHLQLQSKNEALMSHELSLENIKELINKKPNE